MARKVAGSRASPRVHLDEAEDVPPLAKMADNSSNDKHVVDSNRLRRLSFGGGGSGNGGRAFRSGGAALVLPGLDRTNGGRAGGTLAPLPVVKPTFRHVDPRDNRPKVKLDSHRAFHGCCRAICRFP